MTTVLEVRDLEVAFDTRHGRLKAIDGVSLTIGAGEILGVVGESAPASRSPAARGMGFLRRRRHRR